MTKSKQETIYGERIPLNELGLEAPFISDTSKSGILGKIADAYKNLSLVMAGMYTGLNCYGAPYFHREIDGDGDENKTDNRPV
jgi:hypothetical protein